MARYRMRLRTKSGAEHYGISREMTETAIAHQSVAATTNDTVKVTDADGNVIVIKQDSVESVMFEKVGS